MKATLKLKISELIANKTQLNVTDVLSLIEKPKKKEFGEFSFPCFTLAQSKGLAPNVIAKLLASELIATDEVDSITAAGPFVNFKLKRGKFTAKLISQIVSSNLYQEIDLQKNATQTVMLKY